MTVPLTKRLWRGLWRIRIHRTIKLLTTLDEQFIATPDHAVLDVASSNAAITVLARLNNQLAATRPR